MPSRFRLFYLFFILLFISCNKSQKEYAIINPKMANEVTSSLDFCEKNPTTELLFHRRMTDNWYVQDGREHTRVGIHRICYRDDGKISQQMWCTQYCHKPLCDTGGMNKHCADWNWDANDDGVVDLRDYACLQNTATTNCCPYISRRFAAISCG